MDREILVFIELDGETVPVGTLWARARGARQTASFEYDRSWLSRRDAFGIDPVLPPAPGPFHTDRPLFNAFTDPAPDRWGQMLLRRNERRRAQAERRQPRTLQAIDVPTLVDDETRLGALRFKDAGGGTFLTSTGRQVPPLVGLPRLLSAATRVIDDQETDEDLRLILAPGTSLGGARPKATVRDTDGRLSIAKFPRRDDEWPVTRWEAATMTLARSAGVEVAPFQLRQVSNRPVLTARRFDRRNGRRVPFMSALTALETSDNDTRSYLEVVEFLRREGAAVNEDLHQLWRRIVFNMLVSNTDDHLRNHGFLRAPRGWRLSPAYDLNPVPVDVKPRIHALAIDEIDGTASLDTAMGVAPMFGIAEGAARDDRGGGGKGGSRLARCRSSLGHDAGRDRPDVQRVRSRGLEGGDRVGGRAPPVARGRGSCYASPHASVHPTRRPRRRRGRPLVRAEQLRGPRCRGHPDAGRSLFASRSPRRPLHPRRAAHGRGRVAGSFRAAHPCARRPHQPGDPGATARRHAGRALSGTAGSDRPDQSRRRPSRPPSARRSRPATACRSAPWR